MTTTQLVPAPGELADDPMVQAVLDAPLFRSFEIGDEYLLRVNEEPIRVMTVCGRHKGALEPHPAESTYSFVWMPTLEQAVLELLRLGRTFKALALNDGTLMVESGFGGGFRFETGPTVRSATYRLLAIVRGE